jgi:DNA/RNA endonuclease YhcR with UshA esterase domain
MIVMLTVLTYQSIADLYFRQALIFMLERQERRALLLLISVAIVVIASHLILDAVGKRPFAVPYSDASGDGEMVSLTGSIDHLSLTKSGVHLILQVNNTSVFIANPIAQNLTLHTGENISVIGIVQTYQGKKEVVVLAASDISALP